MVIDYAVTYFTVWVVPIIKDMMTLGNRAQVPAIIELAPLAEWQFLSLGGKP